MKKKIFNLCLLIVGLFTTTYHMELVNAYGYDSYVFDNQIFVICGAVVYVIVAIVGILLYFKVSNKENKNKTNLYLIVYFSLLIGIMAFQILLINNTECIIFQNIFTIPFIATCLKIKKMINSEEETVNSEQVNNEIVDEQFETEAINFYKDLQNAKMNFDYEKIKELVSDELYNIYVDKLDELRRKEQKNIIDNIDIVEKFITKKNRVDDKEIIEICLLVSCSDYIINTIDNKVLSGNKKQIQSFEYTLTFERNVEEVEICPECGSNVKNLTECEYCKLKIENKYSKLKLINKKIKNLELE